MRLISWNVNGLRACLGKGFSDSFRALDADLFCIQETKMQPDQATLDLPGCSRFWNSAVRKGYSGTAVFAKAEPLGVRYGLGGFLAQPDTEGRVITAEYPSFFLVNCYAPNSQRDLARLAYRMQWEDAVRAYLLSLDAQKPVIYCGDLNVAHEPIDLRNPKPNEGSAGYTAEERAKMTQLLQSGFTDTFRALYPDKTGAYSWWSYMFHARDHNAGWRIDYMIVSDRLRGSVRDSLLYPQIMGSDHCPVGLEIDL